MDSFIHLFKNPIIVWVCASLLAALAGITFVFWSRRSKQAMVALRQARKALLACPAQKEFAIDFHDQNHRIRTALTPEPVLLDGWENWSAGFLEFQRADGALVISAERPAGEYFNLPAWERRLAMHWYRALPNYMVGLGLCFTFLGVVAVIAGAAASLQAGTNATKHTDALRDLLSAASFKFVTSLVGVFASVVYSFCFRWRQINVERSIAGFVADLSKRVFILNPTALLRQIREEGQRQTGCIETMATNIGVAVGEQFTKAVGVMGEAITTLQTTVHAMALQMGKRADAVKQAIDSLKHAIDGMSGGIVETTSKDLEKLVGAAVEALNSTLKDNMADIAERLKETGAEIEATRAAFSEVAENAGRVRGDYAALSGEIKAKSGEILTMLLNMSSEVDAHLRAAVGAAETIRQSILKAAEKAAGMDSLGEGLAKAADAIEAAAAQWLAMKDDFSRFAAFNDTASQTVKAAVESLKAQWMTQGERLGDIDTHLAATIGAVQQHFEGYAQKLWEYSEAMDSQLGRAINNFNATIETLNDAPERFSAAGVQLQKAAQSTVEALAPLEKLDGLAAAISKSADALRGAIPAVPDKQHE